MEKLIVEFEEKRGDAILLNFRVLQTQFQSIFSEIVPKGRTELVLYGKNFEVNNESQDTVSKNIKCPFK